MGTALGKLLRLQTSVYVGFDSLGACQCPLWWFSRLLPTKRDVEGSIPSGGTNFTFMTPNIHKYYDGRTYQITTHI